MTQANEFFSSLEGVWKNELPDGVFGVEPDLLGWNFISQPKLGIPANPDFQMSFNRIKERLSFKKLTVPARNIGTAGEAGYWDAMQYDIESVDIISNAPIHNETGYILLSLNPDGTTYGETQSDAIRLATVPRANSFLTAGEFTQGSIFGAKDIYDAKPQTTDPDFAGPIEDNFETKRAEITQIGGPDFRKPIEWLTSIGGKIAVTNPVGRDELWVFSFSKDAHPAHMGHGQRVNHPVGIGNLFSDFWITRRYVDRGWFSFLQYAEVVNLEFNGIDWPHVAVNTLFKQKEA